LSAEEGKSRQEKMGLSERKKKESEMFEKLVESNKRRYELEQRLIECEQEIERLTDINANLRTRMKVQSAERTGKIVEMKPEAVVAIQSPGSDVSAL
jgi:chromosome segregation ATPase